MEKRSEKILSWEGRWTYFFQWVKDSDEEILMFVRALVDRTGRG